MLVTLYISGEQFMWLSVVLHVLTAGALTAICALTFLFLTLPLGLGGLVSPLLYITALGLTWFDDNEDA